MMGVNHIAVVEDDAQIRTLLRNLFETEGYVVHEAASGPELFSVLEQEQVDLITLDLNLQGQDGLALARKIRAGRDVPIIMITAKSGDIDRVVGLELGADDYIVKPFNMREVLARVRAVLRRCEAKQPEGDGKRADHEVFSFDGLVLDVTSRELKDRSDQSIDLTTAEFNLLKLFVERPGRVLTRDAIMNFLKGHEWAPLDRSIDALIGRLRKKIEPDLDNPCLIKTVRGIGYIFSTDVTRS